jgi:glycosyltransferase involved in cell wall biosynthesis
VRVAESPTRNHAPSVIHIVENLNRGAVENWLVRMLRFGVERGVPLDWTFYCTLGVKGQLDEEVQKLGARIIYSPVPLGSKVTFMRALRRELRDCHYVMHCHHDLVSAIYLLASIGLPIRKRITHIHNADEGVPTPSRLKASLFRPLLRGVCLAMADCVVGISNHTLDTFLAGRRRTGRDIVHYYGVDPSRFETAGSNRVAFRRELGLADNSRLLLFAGRIVPEKNPLFAVEVFAHLHRLDPTVAGVFVGTGSLDEAVQQRASELGVGAAFRHLGWRSDVATIMCCCDWFILPHPEHPMEGFGLAVVEAQLAGLPMLLSRGVPDDPLLPTARYSRLAIADGPGAWANAAIRLLSEGPPSRVAARAALAQSPFAMDKALAELVSLHQ